MGQYLVGGVSTGAGSLTLPMMSLYAPAGSGGTIRAIGVFNTTAIALIVKLTRLSSTGTQGAALVEGEYDTDGQPPLCTGHNTHTVNPTLVALPLTMPIGAAIGAGYIWTFGGTGLIIKPGTGNGIGVMLDSGAGQICAINFLWEEG